MKPTKVLNEKKLYSSPYNSLSEYDIQHASFHDGQDYATPINREVLTCADGVNVLVYIIPLDSFVFVEEFRTGLFFNGEENPFAIGCVAGMMDKNKSAEDTAREEIIEETGIDASGIDLTPIASVYPSPGRMTEKTHIFLAELNIEPELGIFGLADEGEEIKTHLIKREDAFQMLDENKFASVMTTLALTWFKANR